MVKEEKKKKSYLRKINTRLVNSLMLCIMIVSATTVFADPDPQHQSGWFEEIGDQGALGKGFGLETNIATRGMTIYKDELYIGTENMNKLKLAEIFDDILCQPELVQQSSHQYTPLGGDGDPQLLRGQAHGQQQGGIHIPEYYQQYWDEDYEGYTYTPDGIHYYYLEPETFCLPGLRSLAAMGFFKIATHIRAYLSDGGEIWKYNATTNVWTQIVGEHSVTGMKAGFGYHLNCAISALKEFNAF